jgi:hypothetical protein
MKSLGGENELEIFTPRNPEETKIDGQLKL